MIIEYFGNIVGIDILSFTWETLIDIVYRTPVFLWKSFGNITASIKLFLPGATSTRVAHGGTSSQLILKIISSRWKGLVDDNLKYKHKITSHTAPHTANYAHTAQNATKVTVEHSANFCPRSRSAFWAVCTLPQMHTLPHMQPTHCQLCTHCPICTHCPMCSSHTAPNAPHQEDKV